MLRVGGGRFHVRSVLRVGDFDQDESMDDAVGSRTMLMDRYDANDDDDEEDGVDVDANHVIRKMGGM